MLKLPTEIKQILKVFPNYDIQCLRWHRKPRWVPVAKSKVFRIPPRKVQPEDEKAELKRLNNNYHTQIKSLRRYLTFAHSTRFQASSDPEQQKKLFEEDLARCMAINEKWNAEVKIGREKRVAEELEKDIEYAMNRMAEKDNIHQQKLLEAEEFIKVLKEQSKTFIRPDKIDEAIEEALVKEADYDYAIDLDGNVISGRCGKPENQNIEKASIKQ